METETTMISEETEQFMESSKRDKNRWGKNCFVCGRKFARIGLPTDKDERRKLLWCQLLNVAPPPDSRQKKICEQHFHQDDIIFRDTRPEIGVKPDALPIPFSDSKSSIYLNAIDNGSTESS